MAERNEDLSTRRDIMRKAAVAGAVAWSAPVVLSGPARAAGSDTAPGGGGGPGPMPPLQGTNTGVAGLGGGGVALGSVVTQAIRVPDLNVMGDGQIRVYDDTLTTEQAVFPGRESAAYALVKDSGDNIIACYGGQVARTDLNGDPVPFPHYGSEVIPRNYAPGKTFGPGQFSGVVLGPGGSIFVACAGIVGGGTLVRFSASGAPEGEVLFPPDSQGPRGVAFAPDGDLVVCVGDRLHVYETPLGGGFTFVEEFGVGVVGSGAWGCDVDQWGRTYVADVFGNRVVVLTPDRSAVEKIVSLGPAPPGFFPTRFPYGVAVGSAAQMYVSMANGVVDGAEVRGVVEIWV